MTDEEAREFFKNLKPLTEEELQRRCEENAKIWPKMTEGEARQILREYLERHIPKGMNVWIGEVICHDYTGWSFQAGYTVGETPCKNWHNWGVDAKYKNCGPTLM